MASAPAKPARTFLFVIWRCTGCQKALGQIEGEQLVIKHGGIHLQTSSPSSAAAPPNKSALSARLLARSDLASKASRGT
jgi:hypothetical protein